MNLLPAADLIIIDWPYTTLLEAARTNLPIICHKSFWRLRAGVEDLIKKRCFVADTMEDFRALLKKYLNNELPILKNDELLRRYGTLYNDGKSIQRAIKNLTRIAFQQKREKGAFHELYNRI